MMFCKFDQAGLQESLIDRYGKVIGDASTSKG